MTPAEHYAEAERLLETSRGVYLAEPEQADLVQRAQTHLLAVLAAAGLRTEAAVHGTFAVGRSSPVNVWDRHPDGDVHWAMATSPARAAELARLANLGAQTEAQTPTPMEAP